MTTSFVVMTSRRIGRQVITTTRAMHVEIRERERERVFVCFPDRGIKDRERVKIKFKKNPKQQENKKNLASSVRVCLRHGKDAHKRE